MKRWLFAAVVAAVAMFALVGTASAGDWSLSLTADPTTVVAGEDVTFSGMLLNPSATQGVPNKPVVIRAYGHDSTCTGTYAEIGPTLTVNKSGEYDKGYYSITDEVPINASGDYYVKAFSTFDDLTVTSACVKVTVTPVDDWSLSLSISPHEIVAGTGDPVTFSGTLSNLGSATSVAGQSVTVRSYSTDSTCTTEVAWGPWTVTTAADGSYTTAPIGTGSGPGDYYYKAFGPDGVTSGCEHFTIIPATVTMTFDVTEPAGVVDQWTDVWTHHYTITLNNASHTFTGTAPAQTRTGGATEGTGETITGTLGDDSISYVATRTYDGRTWTVTDAPFNTVVLAATNPPVSWDIDVKITEPVAVP